MPSVEVFCGIKRLRRYVGKEEDLDFSFSYERYEMMGGVGETWLYPALLKKRVSKKFEAVTGCTLGSDDAQEREDKEKRRQVSRTLARLR